MESSGSYGVIVEGPYDKAVFDVLIRRICGGSQIQIEFREADNDGRVVSRAAALLHSFEHVTVTGGPADKALVVRDADAKDPYAIERLIRDRIQGREYPFRNGVAVHAVVREAETWLLADPRAIATVAERRTGRTIAPPHVPRELENVYDAKEVFIRILDSVGLLYTARVCAEIAAEIELADLRTGCASFRSFEVKVVDP